MELLEIRVRASFSPEYAQAVTLLEDMAAEINADSGKSSKVSSAAPRIVLTGVPMGMGSHNILQLLESCGASVVCVDNCSSYKKVRLQMDERRDPLTEPAERYLDTPCSIMSPNPHRYSALRELAASFRPTPWWTSPDRAAGPTRWNRGRLKSLCVKSLISLFCIL